jgi:UDP-N-acetylglucosamine 1-carboxyvinyltransferase
MSYFTVNGGAKLNGSITPQGAKNEALQIVSAVLLTSQTITIHNIPEIIDVLKLIDILQSMGVQVEKLAKNSYSFCAANVDPQYLQSNEYKQKGGHLRGSIMLAGPMLARFGFAYIPKPGGDKIGRRRLDTHIIGFQKLGAQFIYDEDTQSYQLKAPNGLTGSYMLLDEPSVTGTANIIMAASLAQGTTTIYNAACEPYIQQLCKMLMGMGAHINGVGSNLLTITGVHNLGGTTHTVLPDMIEVGSFIGLAALTQSNITIKNAGVKHLGVIPEKFAQLGIKMQIKDDDIIVPEQSMYEIQDFLDGGILTIYDHPWPGLTPDLISILLVTAIQAKGSVLIHQKMFESRLFFTDKLIDMGARMILCDPHRVTVIGLAREQNLRGITMSSPDIRAGVALLLAALSADGVSTIHNIEQIDRGYENIDVRLNALGADIKRISSIA